MDPLRKLATWLVSPIKGLGFGVLGVTSALM